MTANEVPEKIYLNPALDALTEALSEKTKDDIEYTRTDAFIEKADEFISTFFHPDDTEFIDAVLNRFHEHIKLK